MSCVPRQTQLPTQLEVLIQGTLGQGRVENWVERPGLTSPQLASGGFLLPAGAPFPWLSGAHPAGGPGRVLSPDHSRHSKRRRRHPGGPPGSASITVPLPRVWDSTDLWEGLD